MSTLANPKHERFAQELAKGRSQIEAYEAAGYKPDRGAASRLSTNVNVQNRVSQLQSGIACQVVERTAIDRAMVIRELGKIAFASVSKDVRASDKRAALVDICRIEGWIASDTPQPSAEATIPLVERLKAYARQDAIRAAANKVVELKSSGSS